MDKMRLTAKGLICGILIEYKVSNYMEVTDKIWEGLYDLGCARIGDTGLPALVLRKSDGGQFIPVVQQPNK